MASSLADWNGTDRRQPTVNGVDRRAVPRHNPDGVLNEIFGRLRKLKENSPVHDQKRSNGYWIDYGIVPPIE